MGQAKQLQLALDQSGISFKAYQDAQDASGGKLSVEDAITVAKMAYVLHDSWGMYTSDLSDWHMESAWKYFNTCPSNLVDKLVSIFDVAVQKENDDLDDPFARAA